MVPDIKAEYDDPYNNTFNMYSCTIHIICMYLDVTSTLQQFIVLRFNLIQWFIFKGNSGPTPPVMSISNDLNPSTPHRSCQDKIAALEDKVTRSVVKTCDLLF